MNFDDSELLAELASRGLLEKFYDAVDEDNFGRVASILRLADIEEETIKMVLEKIDS